MLDRISADYAGDVTFVAIGGLGEFAATSRRAGEWIPSGRVLWGLDEDQDVWRLFGARSTPSTVLIGSDGRVVEAWAGAVGEATMRERIDGLVAAGG